MNLAGEAGWWSEFRSVSRMSYRELSLTASRSDQGVRLTDWLSQTFIIGIWLINASDHGIQRWTVWTNFGVRCWCHLFANIFNRIDGFTQLIMQTLRFTPTCQRIINSFNQNSIDHFLHPFAVHARWMKCPPRVQCVRVYKTTACPY